MRVTINPEHDHAFVERRAYQPAAPLAHVRLSHGESLDRSPRIRLEVKQDVHDAIALARSVPNLIEDNKEIDV